MHQLRGRVGRGKPRAYAFMLLPAHRVINPSAAKRLKAIEEYSQLGSGFRIALRDLEIRGAGNILGVEQSGHIDAVGYGFYCQLLSAATRRLQGRPEPVRPACHIELNIDCHIPMDYIPSERQRMDVYRRLADCYAPTDLEQLEKDLLDQFGKPPAAVDYLLQMAQIRLLAAPWSISSIVLNPPDVIFTVNNLRIAKSLFTTTPPSPGLDKHLTGPSLGLDKCLTGPTKGTFTTSKARLSLPDDHTIHLRWPRNYWQSPGTILTLLRNMLRPDPHIS
jgi:transcription-repair coupling factor (superfamily II helicase)